MNTSHLECIPFDYGKKMWWRNLQKEVEGDRIGATDTTVLERMLDAVELRM